MNHLSGHFGFMMMVSLFVHKTEMDVIFVELILVHQGCEMLAHTAINLAVCTYWTFI